jgi:hypothetical protein
VVSRRSTGGEAKLGAAGDRIDDVVVIGSLVLSRRWTGRPETDGFEAGESDGIKVPMEAGESDGIKAAADVPLQIRGGRRAGFHSLRNLARRYYACHRGDG